MSVESDALEASVRDGVISPEQAEAIRARSRQVDATEEPIRLATGFADIFICIGVLVIYWSLGAFLRLGMFEPLHLYGAFAALFWILAEFFMFGVRRKFPTILAILLFVWTAYNALAIWYGFNDLFARMRSGWLLFDARAFVPNLAALCGLLFAALLRFRQPILVLFLGLSGTLLAVASARIYMADTSARLVLMGCGIAMLLLGILLDAQDRARTGIKHEWALWLFVLGSPLTVHPLFIGVIADQLEGRYSRTIEAVFKTDFSGVVWIIGALALGFSLLGLVLDRRSLVASTLLYLSAVLTYVSLRSGLGAGMSLALVPLTVGLLVVVLGVAWRPLRLALLAVLPFGRSRGHASPGTSRDIER